MIKNADLLSRLEDDFIRDRGRLTHQQAFLLFESMWKEAVRFGVLPPKDPMDGIEVDIRVAGVLNSCLKRSSQG